MQCHQPCWHGSSDFSGADLMPPALNLIPACPASSCVACATFWHNSPVKLSCRGNVEGLLDDILELKPHVFCSVPRLWNRIYDRVMGTIRESETNRIDQLPLLQTAVCRGMRPPLGSQLQARQFESTVQLLYTSKCCRHMLSHVIWPWPALVCSQCCLPAVLAGQGGRDEG